MQKAINRLHRQILAGVNQGGAHSAHSSLSALYLHPTTAR